MEVAGCQIVEVAQPATCTTRRNLRLAELLLVLLVRGVHARLGVASMIADKYVKAPLSTTKSLLPVSEYVNETVMDAMHKEPLSRLLHGLGRLGNLCRLPNLDNLRNLRLAERLLVRGVHDRLVDVLAGGQQGGGEEVVCCEGEGLHAGQVLHGDLGKLLM